MIRIAIASDHAGYELKDTIMGYLEDKGYQVVNFGTNSPDSCDYPDFAHPAALAVESGQCRFGVAMCGSGNGIQMTLNKHQGIRAALCWLPELASLARQHNDANVLVLPARFISKEKAKRIVDAFFSSSFEGGRHQRRVDKIPANTFIYKPSDSEREFEIGFNTSVYGYHGVEDFEQENGTQFKISLSIRIPFAEEMAEDKIENTISYADLHNIVIKEMHMPRNLMEKVAINIVDMIKMRFPQIISGKLTIKKIQPPVRGLIGDAFVTLNF